MTIAPSANLIAALSTAVPAGASKPAKAAAPLPGLTAGREALEPAARTPGAETSQRSRPPRLGQRLDILV